MSYYTLGHRLPRFISAPLFGDRARYGLRVQPSDPSWREWERVYLDFYYETQKRSAGKIVNDAGYRVMAHVDLAGKTVLEVGPGDIQHLPEWRGRPERYHIADVQEAMLARAAERLSGAGIRHSARLLSRDDRVALPYGDGAFDVVVSFYSLEHLYPLDAYLDEMLRVLKPGGVLVGAIPAEGGLAWGFGRLLTSRRWLKRHTRIDPDKIICWEHPNFAGAILAALDRRLAQRHLAYWPLALPSIDLNLVVRFVYGKR
jgi:SAM-dependent methyltransferase